MDSQEYFKKAEKYDHRLRVATVIAFILLTIVMFSVLIIILKNQNDYHKTSIQQQNTILNDIKNTNLNNELNIKCIVDETYVVGPMPSQAASDKVLNFCIKSTNQPVKGN